VRNGDLETLIASMAENVVFVHDGGEKTGLPRPVHGAEPIARMLLNFTRKLVSANDEIRPARINGLPGFVRFQDGQAQSVTAFDIAEGRIRALFSISNPDKLRHLNRPSPSSSEDA
jgi:RNA polymerase sigma-70 factor (ECF subfamily)